VRVRVCFWQDTINSPSHMCVCACMCVRVRSLSFSLPLFLSLFPSLSLSDLLARSHAHRVLSLSLARALSVSLLRSLGLTFQVLASFDKSMQDLALENLKNEGIDVRVACDLQCVAVRRDVLQCVAMCCSAIDSQE